MDEGYGGWTGVLGLDCFARLAMTAHGAGTGEGGFETRPYVYCTTRNPRPNPHNCQLSIVNCHNLRPSQTSLIFDI
ncbi:MAG: hypothetical protein LBM98_00535 [Oscillospiraceae bacterium]|nr:hypothetical protein [Oscillospiraceae bacterium]